MHVKTAWSDYFTGSATPQQSKLYTSTQILTDSSVYILNCLFRSCTSTDKGGAIYCTSVTYLLIESSSFFSCNTSNQNGGAIFFYNTGNGQCVLHEVCGYDCCSTYTGSSIGQFAYIYVNNAISSKNYINFSSIVRCVNMRTDSCATLYVFYGKVCYPSVNISMNKCQCYSGIYCDPFRDLNSFTGSFTYSSFTDNSANGDTCIYTWWGSVNIEFKSCNILRNTQVSSSGGTIYTVDNLMITDSCILENRATYIFHQGRTSCTITLSNCTVDLISNNGYLTTQNTVTKSFILALNHISTKNCNSEYDSVGYLTPIIQPTPPTKERIHRFTCEKCSYRPLSFAFTFIFNFIPPYASIDL
jgi:predicted outer membrane repeat protein